jgi:hypothetical protein
MTHPGGRRGEPGLVVCRPMFAKAKGVRTVNAPKTDKLAHNQVVEPVTKTVTPVSQAETPPVVGGGNTPSTDKVKSPNP